MLENQWLLAGQLLLHIINFQSPPGSHYSVNENQFELSGVLPQSGSGPGASIVLQHEIQQPTHLWMPHLAPEPGDVIADHAFRSPAFIVADEQTALALIPELEDVAQLHAHGLQAWFDYDHPQRQLTFTVGKYNTAGHVFFKASEVAYHGQSFRLRVHVLTSNNPTDLANPYGLVARWHWQHVAQPNLKPTIDVPYDAYCQHIVRWAFKSGWTETLWQEFELNGQRVGAPVFIVDVAQHPSIPREERKWREHKAIWNQAWFSTQRCANGMLRYARMTHDGELERKARLCTQLALAAPDRDGLFPSVYIANPTDSSLGIINEADESDWRQGRWVNSNRRPADVPEDAIHVLDAVFTARQLLEWHDLTGDEAALRKALGVGRALLRLQRESGAFPGWVRADGSIVKALAEGPETAQGVSLLLELAQSGHEKQRFQAAAEKCLNFLKRDVIANGRWEDFETYFSCCRWGTPELIGQRVARNGIYKQNTLSIAWCAEALLLAHQTWGRDADLALGQRCLDELSLWQQVWNPPFIPAPCLGGFGVMNADGEWNDARQSLFADLYLRYWKATGQAEYRQRGLAALQASFYMLYCPENPEVKQRYEATHKNFGAESYGFMMENIAHGGPITRPDHAVGSFTIFSWGNGAALSSYAKIRERYSELFE